MTKYESRVQRKRLFLCCWTEKETQSVGRRSGRLSAAVIATGFLTSL